jgi:hypothetical protein
MVKRVIVFVFVALIHASGCASMRAVPLDQSFWQEKGRRVGVALEEMPEAVVLINAADTAIGHGRSTIFPDEAQYTDHPMRLHETRALRQASRGARGEGFDAVQDLLVQGLVERGFTAYKVDMPADTGTLKSFREGSGDGVYACRDYRDLGKSAGADYLVIVRLEQYGTLCRYIDLNNYEVEVYAGVRAEMIETSTNRVLWRSCMSGGRFTRTVDAECSRPDHVPVILDGLEGLLEDAARSVAGQFFSSSPTPGNTIEPVHE